MKTIGPLLALKYEELDCWSNKDSFYQDPPDNTGQRSLRRDLKSDPSVSLLERNWSQLSSRFQISLSFSLKIELNSLPDCFAALSASSITRLSSEEIGEFFLVDVALIGLNSHPDVCVFFSRCHQGMFDIHFILVAGPAAAERRC